MIRNNTCQTALITGASRGIGASCAAEFAAAGYNLILTCNKSMTDLQALANKLTAEYSVECRCFQADLGCEADVVKLFSKVDSLDVLVNNAGMAHFGLLSDMTADEWHRIFAVNLDSCFYTCRAAIPLMLQNHSGKIINISSVWGTQGASLEVAYSATKGGMNAFTKALAKELAPSNIQVNAISCGVIDTTMNSCLSSEDIEALTAEIPADRLGTPKEVAQLVLQTAQSPSYMTGQIITIDGGWY